MEHERTSARPTVVSVKVGPRMPKEIGRPALGLSLSPLSAVLMTVRVRTSGDEGKAVLRRLPRTPRAELVNRQPAVRTSPLYELVHVEHAWRMRGPKRIANVN